MTALKLVRAVASSTETGSRRVGARLLLAGGWYGILAEDLST